MRARASSNWRWNASQSDRKSTRLNSSHVANSYAVFCLKKNKVGFKAISETVESSASIYSDPERIQIKLPDDFEMPPGGLNIRWPDPPLEAERRLFGPKMAAVQAFARANQLDRIVLDSKPARLGIVATGKAYLDLRQALADLGISDKDAEALGLRIYKVALTWPLEESGAKRFAEGLQDVLVVEEKRGFIEDQLMRILYNI